MDGERFDALTRRLRSRRTALAGLLSGVAALLNLASADEAHAHNLVPGCQKLKDATRRAACLSRARRHNRNQHSCKPKPAATFCANRCGSTQNNCKKKVNCTCPAGKSCLANLGCNRTCSAAQPLCPAGCTCGLFLAESPDRTTSQCVGVPSLGDLSCEQLPHCVTSANCPRGYFCGELTATCGTDRCVPNCPY